MLLNIVVFAWYGAVAPWVQFRTNNVIPIYRLICLAILILLFRRIPMVLLFRHHLREIGDWQQALFAGFFGPIGVSAVFYLYVSLEFLDQITVNGEVREDAQKLQEVITVVVWFLAISSIVVHGLSVPLGKLGYTMPRTVSQALSTESEQRTTVYRRHKVPNPLGTTRQGQNQQTPKNNPPQPMSFVLGRRSNDALDEPSRPITIINDSSEDLEMQRPGEPFRQADGQARDNSDEKE